MHIRNSTLAILALLASACASLSQRDPLYIDVAGIEQIPGEGMELVLALQIRVQNPNDAPVEYDGVALALDINGQKLAAGVSDEVGVVPRYGETVFTIPMTISAFDVARQLYRYMSADEPSELRYSVRGKLEGGLFGTRRFQDEGMFTLAPPERRPPH